MKICSTGPSKFKSLKLLETVVSLLKARECAIYAVLLFFASCIHSLKKSQLETKRGGNKRQAYNYKKSFLVLLTSLR